LALIHSQAAAARMASVSAVDDWLNYYCDNDVIKCRSWHRHYPHKSESSIALLGVLQRLLGVCPKLKDHLDMTRTSIKMYWGIFRYCYFKYIGSCASTCIWQVLFVVGTANVLDYWYIYKKLYIVVLHTSYTIGPYHIRTIAVSHSWHNQNCSLHTMRRAPTGHSVNIGTMVPGIPPYVKATCLPTDLNRWRQERYKKNTHLNTSHINNRQNNADIIIVVYSRKLYYHSNFNT